MLKPMEKKLTSFDIACIAGVSQTSVSLVLRGKWRGRVGKETAEKIQQVCTRYNYRVNYAASALKSGKSRTISLVVPDSENPFFSRILHSLRVKSIPKGYECMLVETASSDTWYDYIEGSLIGGETAYAVNLYNDIENVNPAIKDSVITVGDTKGTGSSITIDFKGAVEEAVSLIYQAGYESILYLRSIKDRADGVRECAFRSTAEEKGIESGELLVTGHIENDVYSLLSSRKDNMKKRQALLLNDDLYAKGVYRYAEDNALAVGRDIGILSLNNTYICDCFTPHLSSFGFDTEKLVSAIMEIIENGDKGRTVMLDTHINDGMSF